MNSKVAELGRRVLGGERLSRSEIMCLVKASGEGGGVDDLFYWSNKVRKAHFADNVRLCSIIAGTLGACSEDCKWCAQSSVSAAGVIKPNCSKPEDMIVAAGEASRLGCASFGIVNSGRTPAARDLLDVETAAKDICNIYNLCICASLGELTGSQASSLAAAGVKRYNHNLETSREFFPKVVTTHSYDDRLSTLRTARAAGMELCCGGLFGMGESWEDRIDLALELRDEVQPDVVPLNFLHRIPGTVLDAARPLKPTEILRIIALFRLVLPTVDLKVAGGREANLRDMQSWIFYVGATSIILGNYLTTAGRSANDDIRMIEDLGLQIVRKTLKTAGSPK